MSETAAITAPLVIIVFLGILLTAGYLYFVRKGPAFTAKYKLFGLSPPPKVKANGFTAPGYERLKELIQKEFEDGYDFGSQFAAYVNGELVADIASGFTDQSYTTPYTPYNLQLVFSSSKFVTSSVFLHLVNTSRINLDDLVTKYWPEFGAGNKHNVTVAQILHHRGGVAYLDKDRVPTPEDLVNLDVLAQKIAAQPHNFNGAEVSAYHAVTRGWFLNEIVRRATGGKTIRDIMYDEVMPIINAKRAEGVEPFEFNYGIPDEPLERAEAVKAKLVKLSGFTLLQKIFFILTPRGLLKALGLYAIPQGLINALLKKGSPQNNSLFRSGPDFTGREKEFPWNYNDETLLHSQSPSFACLTNARSLAHLAEQLRKSHISDTDGLISKATFAEGMESMKLLHDEVLDAEIQFLKIGFAKLNHGFGAEGYGSYVATDVCFYGWSGAGGSIVCFDLEYGISFSYAMNFCHHQTIGDQRSWILIEELVRVVKELRRVG
ncbi:hypothetical protein HK100_004126 [Physocladia obscura]|uniref:Beta-lactamase-related domain-containing protein n=1 Tax=Physocladia obscura TaxID=109957 RepID=A0AAD5XL09_9FUNG|nr:hypothetical protein HK100_004126 [Physocladia obscura]